MAAGTLLFCFTGYSLYLFRFQEKMIYHPRSYGAAHELALGMVQPITYRTSQGSQTSFYLGPKEDTVPQRLWVLFAGNGSLSLDWVDFLIRLGPPAGDGFLMMEYPSYGRCEGIPSPETILESSQVGFNALLNRLQITPSGLRVSVLGHSLGAAAALQFGATQNVEKVILAAPFTSMRAMAERVVGRPFGWLLKHNFDNVRELARLVAGPRPPQVIIFHGEKDQLIPVDMGRELARLHPGFVSFHLIEAGTHESTLYQAIGPIRTAMRGAN